MVLWYDAQVMCIVLFAYKCHPGYDLVVASNRDEFYQRRSEPARFWEDEPLILAGKDTRSGGTWLGITREGRFALVTNYRDFSTRVEHAASRGLLVRDFLTGNHTPAEYAGTLPGSPESYNGYNLLLGDRDGIVYHSNRQEGPVEVTPGIHGLSNHLLDTPWPKVTRGKDLFARLLEDHPVPDPRDLLEVLADRDVPPDESLPDTGIGLEWERVLSRIFIASDTYGTRASTALLVGSGGDVRFLERSFESRDDPGSDVEVSFVIR